MDQDLHHPDLNSATIGSTEISRIEGGFLYRGYCVHDLAAGSCFLEVAHLLLFDEIPYEEQFADFLSIIADEQCLSESILQIFEQLPLHSSPMDVLLTGISLLSLHDPQSSDSILRTGHSQTLRLLAKVPLLISAWQCLRQGVAPITPDLSASYVSNLYLGIAGQVPHPDVERALEVALITCAEHEFAPSTYAARIAASTKGRIYGPIISALEVLMGQNPGGGDDSPLDILDEVHSPDNVEQWIDSQPESRHFAGFGHSVHRTSDPRCMILEAECERLAKLTGREDLQQLADVIERAIWKSRKLPPNLDWTLSRLFALMGIERDLFKPLFAVARLVGWSAHALEQAESGEPIRPRARYIGAEDCDYESMKI